MTQLSEHFSLAELTFSQVAQRTGIENDPSADPIVMANLQRLCELLLEPARIILGVPLHVDSGYRSQFVNDQVGGAVNSAHIEGRAADILPIGRAILEAFHDLRISEGLPYDQLIFECEAWIHLSVAPEGQEPRREALLAQGGPGHWSYQALV